ncbi:MAG: hypothetical protein LUQ65_12975 [Candidatus Helarchaeota archaeon]|nr:hypothetical protein [Candidatus Helarchaeota archaeon]
MDGLDFIQVISVIELFIAAGIAGVLSLLIYKKYSEKPARVTLNFALNFTLVCFSLASIAINRILLTYLTDPFLGLLFHNFAVLGSLCIIFLLDIFVFEMTYPKHVTKLAILFGILLLIAGIILLLNQPTIGPQQELLYSDLMLFMVLPLLIPPMFIPATIFFLYAVKVRKESVPKSNRALIMGIATIVIIIGYTLELMGMTGLPVIFVRLTFVIYMLLMYFAFTKRWE